MMLRLARVTGLVGAMLLAAAPTAAQRGRWQSAQCELNTGHYLVNSAVLYLRNATETRFPDQRERDMRDALRVLNQAIDQGRTDDPAVWYLLGRYYRMETDLPGADSAFDRAETLAPACATDINVYRRQLWVPTLNRGVDAVQNGEDDAARAAFYEAEAIFSLEPPAPYYLAQIYTTDEPDSAIAYYREAIARASDSANAANESYQGIKRNSTFNAARLFHREEQYDSAAAWYRRYREIDPDDAQALTGLAEVLAAGGHVDEGLALYDTVLARADSLPTLDVFATGVALYRAERYERAAEAFEKGLERNPQFRDALFNLANTYLSMADDSGTATARRRELGERMEPVVRRLIEVDPHNEASQRLLAASYQLRGMSDSTLAVLERVEAAPFHITVSLFQSVGGGTWEVRGLITTVGDAAVPVPEITFEFIDEPGEVVHTEVLPAQSVEAAAPFGFRVLGETIAAWRYRVGS
jgi:tetratricopeptide (TPR) repeat protein